MRYSSRTNTATTSAASPRLHAGLPVYCSEGTAGAGRLVDRGVQWRDPVSGVRQDIGALVVDPFEVPHDAAEPLQYVFSDGERRLGLLTDVGEPTARSSRRCAASTR